MFRYIFFVFFLFVTLSSFSQTQEKKNIVMIDSAFWNSYQSVVDGILFNYPKTWNIKNVDDKYLFSAIEKLTTPSDKFQENLFFGKVEISESLDFLLKSAAKSLKANNDKIEFIQDQIKNNANGIEYAILKYTSIVGNVNCCTTNIYFSFHLFHYFHILLLI